MKYGNASFAQLFALRKQWYASSSKSYDYRIQGYDFTILLLAIKKQWNDTSTQSNDYAIKGYAFNTLSYAHRIMKDASPIQAYGFTIQAYAFLEKSCSLDTLGKNIDKQSDRFIVTPSLKGLNIRSDG